MVREANNQRGTVTLLAINVHPNIVKETRESSTPTPINIDPHNPSFSSIGQLFESLAT